MPLNEILAEAGEAERQKRERRERESAAAAHALAEAVETIHRALDKRDPKSGTPDLFNISLALHNIGHALPLVHHDDFAGRQARRAAAHVLAQASLALDHNYAGDRSDTPMPAPIPRHRLPPIPADSDDDL